MRLVKASNRTVSIVTARCGVYLVSSWSCGGGGRLWLSPLAGVRGTMIGGSTRVGASVPSEARSLSFYSTTSGAPWKPAFHTHAGGQAASYRGKQTESVQRALPTAGTDINSINNLLTGTQATPNVALSANAASAACDANVTAEPVAASVFNITCCSPGCRSHRPQLRRRRFNRLPSRTARSTCVRARSL